MTLPAHTQHTAAGLAVEEGVRPELVAFGDKNLAVTNMRQDQRGELTTRNGFAQVFNTRSSGTQPTAGYKLFSDGKSPCRITELGQIEVYDAAGSRWTPVPGRVSECLPQLLDLPAVGNCHVEDIAYSNGYLVIVWAVPLVSAPCFVGIINANTGAVVQPPTSLGTVERRSFLVALGSTVYLVRAVDGGAGTIKCWSISTASAAGITAGWTALTNLAADFYSGDKIAVAAMPHATTPKFAIVYPNNSGGASDLTVKVVTNGAVSDTATINTGSVGVAAAALDIAGAIGDTLWVAWDDTANTKLRGYNPANLASVTAATATILTGVASFIGIALDPSTAATGRIITYVGAATGCKTIGFNIVGATTTAVGTSKTVVQVYPGGRPNTVGTRYLMPLFLGELDTTVQAQLVIADWTDAVTYMRPVVNPSPGLSTISGWQQCQIAKDTAGTKAYFGLGIKRSAVGDASAALVMDFASSRRWQSARFAGSTFLTGGMISYFDGVRMSEASFLARPTQPTGTGGAAGVVNGTVRYVAVYEAVDSDGNWNVSGVSAPSAVVTVANKIVSVATTPLTVSSRLGTSSTDASVRVAWYRTATGAVAPYYRLGTTLNDTSAATVTFSDNVADATLIAASKLYSQPGVLGTSQDKRPPPFFQCLTTYNGMLVGASGSDVWYSGQNVAGEGVWFNPIFQVPVPGEGDITALWVMDGTLFVAKQREIFAISGEAPSDNGTVGGLGLPRRLAVDVGCIEVRSVCVTALGTFFQSDRGIEILTRAQSVEWIGEPYQETLALFPIVTSATVEPVSCTVLIELAASESAGLVTGTGRALVFDLSLKTWVSADRRTSAGGAVDTPSQSACMIYTGSAYRYAWIDAFGVTSYETPGAFVHTDSTFVVGSYETAWLKHGLQQEQRVWQGVILFQRNTAAGLKIEVAYDYADYSSANDKVWTETETLGQRQLPYAPKVRGQAMKFRVSATAPAVIGTGQGFTFIGMSFDLAAKQGPTKGNVRLNPALRK